MNTRWWITHIKRRTGEDRSDILDMMQILQEEVYSVNCAQTEKIDDTTGMPPYLATTADDYYYDLPSDCREVKALFTDEMNSTYSRTRPVTPVKEYYYRNKGYKRVAVSTRSARPGQVAQLYFHNDPGTTTTKYYLHYWIQPPTITDAAQDLYIPKHLHRRFADGVIQIFNGYKFGKTQKTEAIIDDIARRIRNHLGRGQQSRLGITPIPEQYQDGYFDDRYI